MEVKRHAKIKGKEKQKEKEKKYRRQEEGKDKGVKERKKRQSGSVECHQGLPWMPLRKFLCDSHLSDSLEPTMAFCVAHIIDWFISEDKMPP